MNIDKNDNLPLKSPIPYDIIITVVDECPVSAFAQSRPAVGIVDRQARLCAR